MFHDMLGNFMEIYIDDVVIKSNSFEEHLKHLQTSLERLRAKKLKMNPLKCAFGVSTGDFLGFLVHQRGIEVPKIETRLSWNLNLHHVRRNYRVFSA